MSTLTTADWSAAAAALAGDVLLPGSPEYEHLRAPAMARFDGVRPEAIVRCQTCEDVSEALGLARRFGLQIAVRAGGHCFEGGSSTRGLLIDVGSLDGVSLEDGVATVGAGTRLGALYDALDRHGRTTAAGCGPTVGIAGLALGGGCGILGRRHGLTCDQVLAAEVALADGRVIFCDERRHAELLWALRGAGGLRFGVVTRLVLRTVPAPHATRFDLRWPEPAAVALVDAWQRWAPDAPDGVAASLLVTAPADRERPVVVRVFGAAVDADEAETLDLLDALVARAGAQPATASLEHLPYRETKRRLAEPEPGPAAKPEPGRLFAKSHFFPAGLSAEAIGALIEHLARNRADGQSRELDFTPWAGAYNRVPADATAFPHRSERFMLKHEVVVGSENLSPPARDWLRRSWALGHSAGGHGAYVNFPDADLGRWARAYHGANLDRLQRVKARYDPESTL
jgi:FAD/FMN-containing dehydrogenase